MMAEVKFYWRLLLRRLPIMLAIVIICSAAGLIQAVRLPATYEAAARLLVESAIVEREIGTTSADEELQIVRERLLTRANLLEIAADFDVFENRAEIPPDRLLALMQSRTSIESRGGRNQATVINISFGARSGQIAADVVNEYVTRIIATSVDRRLEQARQNVSFNEQEVDRLSGELDEISASISDFQTDNADALPTDQDFRLTRQAALQENLSNAQRQLASLIEQRVRVVEVFESTGQIADDGNLTDDQRQLRDLERELASELTVRSEEAPQITLLRRRIETLRNQVTAAAGPEGSSSASQRLLELQLGQIDAQVEDMEAIIEQARGELARLEDAISRSPLNGVALEAMQRNYERTRSLYDLAANELQQARIDLRVQETNRGQRITLIEAATVPRDPASPNRRLIAFFGGVIGLALAGGLFLVVELLNRTVRRPIEIQRALGIEPLATVPYIETRRERMGRMVRRGVAIVLVVVGIPAALWAVDSYYRPLDQLANELIALLNLV